MKVILIQPTVKIKATIGPPLGLAYIAAVLEKSGHDVKIIDLGIFGYKFNDIKRKISSFDPDVVGISSTAMYIYYTLSIAKFAKENNPNSVIVLGGPHPTVRAKEILEKNHYVDVIVRGEGELTFVELLKRTNRLEWKNVKGITFRSNDKIIENEDREIIEDIDSIPFPAYHLLPMNKYRIKFLDNNVLGIIGQRYIGINTSRGCPNDCIFCSSRRLWGRKWRARRPEKVLEEICFLKDKYKIDVVDFVDDAFSIDKKRTEKICNLIKDERLDLSLVCTTRVDNFDKKLSFNLKKAGCNIVFFGFESGVQKTLDYLCKGFTLEDIVSAVKNAKQAKLKIGGSFIIGTPVETKYMIYQTINFAKKLKLNTASFCIFTPFPGTKIYDMAEKNNLFLTDDWSKYNASNPILKLDGFTAEELIDIYKKSNFYYFIIKALNSIYSWNI
jgi:anaerobic magnesium-protoporphyrin IX monomethyl ester cyclase